ncbi:MAG: RsmB/NOP family class I SAM-dependent RNA methyltransferase [Chlamydiae bacterium]|nr:RsmB/NOP family class I SAM-dependent RNA methyltransferase [Chlamydiota bacterium]
MKNFRTYHLINILNAFDTSFLPLDVFLSQFFRSHKAIGSKDRSYICEKIYALIRWKSLLDYFCKKPVTWEKRLQLLEQEDLGVLQKNPSLPPHIQLSCPYPLFNKLLQAFGPQKTEQFCKVSNTQAPTTVRINALKTTRDHLLQLWQPQYDIEICRQSPHGISFKKRINFFELQEFKNGLFEIQDEGSQLVALQMQVQPSDHVLDFCAGAGGKTLALAPKMQGKGQLYLYDIRPHALLQAKKRLKRAGIQNAQYLTIPLLKKKSLIKRMDWILLDVPCSGTGTLRRNPDMKWQFSNDTVVRLVEEQRAIFEKALPYLAPGGHIVYATCSVLPEENLQQVHYFIEKYGLKLATPPLVTFPEEGGMDGFFAATLIRV